MPDGGKDAIWLTGLLLKMTELTGSANPSDLTLMDTFEGTTGTFEIYGRDGEPIVVTDVWRLYPAKLPGGQLGLMKIAAGTEWNSALDHEAEILLRLQRTAAENDAEAISQGKKPYFQDAQIPRVAEKIVTDDGRTVLFLAFHPEFFEQYDELQPMPLAIPDDKRIDIQSAVWILGKTLRLLDFAHRENHILVGAIAPDNILIEPSRHGVFVFDWSQARANPNSAECNKEVAYAARMTWNLCGGYFPRKEPPLDIDIAGSIQHTNFLVYLQGLMLGNTSAAEAHRKLYQLADEIWGREPSRDGGTKRPFHEFCLYDRA